MYQEKSLSKLLSFLQSNFKFENRILQYPVFHISYLFRCSDEPECMLNHIGLSDCLLVDQGPLGFAYNCHFCCVGNNCNKGPQLIPPAQTHYNKTL